MVTLPKPLCECVWPEAPLTPVRVPHSFKFHFLYLTHTHTATAQQPVRVCKNVESRVVLWPTPSLTHSLCLSILHCLSHFFNLFLSVSLHPMNNQTIVNRTAGLQLKLFFSLLLSRPLSLSVSLSSSPSWCFVSYDEMRHTHFQHASYGSLNR